MRPQWLTRNFFRKHVEALDYPGRKAAYLDKEKHFCQRNHKQAIHGIKAISGQHVTWFT